MLSNTIMKLPGKTTIPALVSVAVIFSTTASAISLTQSINKTEMAFEDRAVFEISIEWPGQQFAYRFPEPLNPYFDRLKVEKFTSSISSVGQGKDEITTKKFIYVLAPTSGGQGKIDPITINFLTWPDSSAGELVTEQVSIMIAEPKAASKSSNLPLWIPIIGAILLLGSGAAVFISVSKAKKEKIPLKSPGVTALEELSQLKSEAGTDLKRFQTGVYNILSKFMSSKYRLNVSGHTEEKLDEILANSPLSEQHRVIVRNWLVQAERDKFRPVESSPGETLRLETELRRFFETLK